MKVTIRGILKNIFFVKKIYQVYFERKKQKLFKKQFILFKEKSIEENVRKRLEWEDRYLCLGDNTENTGFDTHYVYHPAWAARILAYTKPKRHVDISSSLSFITMISAFIPVEFYDYRPVKLNLSGLQTGSADLLKLPFDDNSQCSLSCMHVIEHIGLGRYGDELDPLGDFKAIKELKRVLSVGGDLLFVVPIGPSKIMFNAHRIYSYNEIVTLFNDFELKSFSLIPDNAEDIGILDNPHENLVNNQKYGCGCFWFRKNEVVK